MDSTCPEPELPNDPVAIVEDKLETLILPSLADFDEWTSFIAKTERKSSDDIKNICMVYDSFLSEFPLCYGYWKKYASHKARLCSMDGVVEVYERAVQSATYSVDLWVDYCSFGMFLFKDFADIRRLFERGISYVGKDYLCYRLWDKYIEFEYSQKQWSSLALLYIRTLKFPTKKLDRYYDSVKNLAAIFQEEIEFQGSGVGGSKLDTACNTGMPDKTSYEDEDMSTVIRDLLDPAVGLSSSNALQRYLSTGKQLYEKASLIDAKIRVFESVIRRPYFHVKPLEISQLENWHQYLDFVETQSDFDWTVKLYERCLIPCANYPEFWMRYVELMESMGGREIANFALHRATTIFVKRVPEIHLFCARFMEKIGDAIGTRAAFCKCDSDTDSEFIANVKREANMEKRMGNSESAFKIYEKALSMTKEKHKLQICSILYVEFSKFKYMVTGSVDVARDVLFEGIQRFPHCRLLIEEFINFEMRHRAPKSINTTDSLVARAISSMGDVSQGLTSKDCEDISSLYIEFVDQFGTIQDIMKAWNRHRKLFPHLLRPSLSNHKTGKQERPIVVLPNHASGNDKSDAPVGASELDKIDKKLSQHENPAILLIHAVNMESHSEDIQGSADTLETEECPSVIEQSEKDLTEPNMEAHNVGHMDNNICDVTDRQDHMVEANKEQKMTDEPTDNLRPLSLENLSLTSDDNETQGCSPATSHPCKHNLETSRSNIGKMHDDLPEQEASYIPNETCMQAESSLQVHGKTEYGPSIVPEISNSVPTGPTLAHTHSSTPATIPSHSNAVSGGIWNQNQMSAGQVLVEAKNAFNGYLQNQPQQLQSSSQPQHQPSSTNSQMHASHVYPGQSQSLSHQQMHPRNQASNQYQDSAAEVQSASVHPWPVQNMQQQSFTPPSQPHTGPLPVYYTQGQMYQYPVQSNVPYGYMQANQGYAPHILQYYYQQQQQQLQTYEQIHPWNNSYYQQHPPVQHYGSNPYGQEYGQHSVGSQEQIEKERSQHRKSSLTLQSVLWSSNSSCYGGI